MGPAVVLILVGTLIFAGVIFALVLWLATKSQIPLGYGGMVLLFAACFCIAANGASLIQDPSAISLTVRNLGLSIAVFALIFGAWLRPSSDQWGRFLVLTLLIGSSASLVSSPLISWAQFWVERFYPDPALMHAAYSNAGNPADVPKLLARMEAKYFIFATVFTQVLVLWFFKKPISGLEVIGLKAISFIAIAWTGLVFGVQKLLKG